MVNVKSFKHGERTSTIKLEFTMRKDEKTIEALYALLGGYNQVSRNVSVERYRALKEKLEAAVNDMAYEIAVR